MDRKLLFCLRLLFIVDGLAQYVENTSQRILSHRDHDRSSGGHGFHTADKAVCGTQSDTSYRIVTKMLGNLHHKRAPVLPGDLNGVIDLRKSALGKLNIQNGTDDLSDLTNAFLCHPLSPCFDFNFTLRSHSLRR